MKLLYSIFIASIISTVNCDHKVGWEIRDTGLPKALSDHSASISDTGLVYIAGGCDHPDGNTWIPTEGDDGFFACGSLSDSFYVFDTETEEFKELESLPRARYRHCSVFVNDQVWLVGGRTLLDSLISEIDVFDINTGDWSTFSGLAEEYVVSDQACFNQEPSYVYVAGGYDQNYTALSTVYRFDAAGFDSEASTPLDIEKVAPLLEARGDITGITAGDGDYAFVSGGFTHENKFCDPLDSVERYSFGADAWNNLPPLINGRGEIVLVELDDHLYAMGGERPIEGICDLVEAPDIGEGGVGTELVEVYAGDKWKVIAGFPDHKFRFAAVAWSKTGLIYAFGGQTAFDDDCNCFKTSSDLAVLGEGLGSSASAFKLSFVLSLTAGLFGWAML